MQVTATSLVPLPIDQAFEVVADMPTWFPKVDDGIDSCDKVSDGPTGVGTHFHEMVQGPFGVMLFDIEVKAWSPPQTVAFTSSGPILVADGGMKLTAVDGGTEVTMHYSGSPRGLGWLMWPLLYFTLEGVEQKRMEKLAELVRSGEISAT